MVTDFLSLSLSLSLLSSPTFQPRLFTLSLSSTLFFSPHLTSSHLNCFNSSIPLSTSLYSPIMSASRVALRPVTHRAPRTLTSRLLSSRPSSLLARNNNNTSSSFKTLNSSLPRVSRFSTMSPLQQASPAPTTDKSYDPEIKDMADYIHNYKVDSDLAV